MPQANQAAPDPLYIKYPDGQVMASGVYIWSVADNKYIPWTGEVTVGSVTSSGIIADGVDTSIKATVLNKIGTGGATNPQAVIIVDTSGNPVSGSAVSISDGADVAEGAIADAVVAAGASGTVSAKLRAISRDIATRALESGGNLATLAGAVTSNKFQDNIAQLAGTTVDVNSGNKSAGTLRVVLATDQPQLTNKLLVTPDANSAVNVGQINGVTPLMGAGNTGTGSPRVTIASDQVAIPVNLSGQTKTIKTVSGSVTADTDIITAVSSKRLKVFAYAFFTYGTSANVLLLKSNGTSGTLLWSLTLQALASTMAGANLTTSVPSFLFATVASEKLTLDVSSSDTIYYNISYWDDDAT